MNNEPNVYSNIKNTDKMQDSLILAQFSAIIIKKKSNVRNCTVHGNMKLLSHFKLQTVQDAKYMKMQMCTMCFPIFNNSIILIKVPVASTLILRLL